MHRDGIEVGARMESIAPLLLESDRIRVPQRDRMVGPEALAGSSVVNREVALGLES